MSSGERLQDLVCHQGAVLACDVSPDGQLFATTSADKTAKVTHTRVISMRQNLA